MAFMGSSFLDKKIFTLLSYSEIGFCASPGSVFFPVFSCFFQNLSVIHPEKTFCVGEDNEKGKPT